MKAFTVTFSFGAGYIEQDRVSETITMPDEMASFWSTDARPDFITIMSGYRGLIEQRVKTLEINAKARE